MLHQGTVKAGRYAIRSRGVEPTASEGFYAATRVKNGGAANPNIVWVVMNARPRTAGPEYRTRDGCLRFTQIMASTEGWLLAMRLFGLFD